MMAIMLENERAQPAVSTQSLLRDLSGVGIANGGGTSCGKGGQTSKENLDLNVSDSFDRKGEKGNPCLTYQERTQGRRFVVIAPDYAQAQNGNHRNGVWIHGQGPSADRIGKQGGGDHGKNLDTA